MSAILELKPGSGFYDEPKLFHVNPVSEDVSAGLTTIRQADVSL
jgi:hypothetical protein